MRNILAGLAAIALVASLGCYHGPSHASTYGPGRTSIERTDRVIYADNLTYKVYVVSMNSGVLADGRLRVSAELENRTGKNLVIQVQTQFRDAAGNLTEDKTNWRTVVMPPHSSSSYHADSMNNQSKDYVVRVKLEDRH